ncbi:hypothetical protein HAX54_027194 [Datura stramonium]|uniref:A-kinase anchor protein 7-like phosphoesterase domain-containing protein n=1 Tax=Datura stramonium TaxID=4076 RepID=A0ABS8RL35_DATST|nr:hypothetical protein [Datura stramonium]
MFFYSTDLGIEKSIFIKPQSFHLTVLMLKLWNNDRIEAAAEVLRSVSPKVIDALKGEPVSIRLKGLACMRGSPEKAYVVYAPVEVIGGDARLLRACQVMINAFIEAGLVLEKDANQKLKKSGESVVSAKLIFRKGSCTTTMVISIAVLPSHFLKRSWAHFVISVNVIGPSGPTKRTLYSIINSGNTRYPDLGFPSLHSYQRAAASNGG